MESVSEQNSRTRCVVWHHCGVAASSALIRALESRLLRVETSGSGHEVLAMACRQQRLADEIQEMGQVSQIEGGTGGGKGLIVVLDAGGAGGGCLSQQSRVIEAMERFSPSALIWIYQSGANPPIRAFVEGGAFLCSASAVSQSSQSQSPQSQSPQSQSNSQARPELKISGTVQLRRNGISLQSSDVLDHDELTALLKPNSENPK